MFLFSTLRKTEFPRCPGTRFWTRNFASSGTEPIKKIFSDLIDIFSLPSSIKEVLRVTCPADTLVMICDCAAQPTYVLLDMSEGDIH